MHTHTEIWGMQVGDWNVTTTKNHLIHSEKKSMVQRLEIECVHGKCSKQVMHQKGSLGMLKETLRIIEK